MSEAGLPFTATAAKGNPERASSVGRRIASFKVTLLGITQQPGLGYSRELVQPPQLSPSESAFTGSVTRDRNARLFQA